MQLNGIDAELWGPDEIRKRLPLMSQSLELALSAERRRMAAERRHRASRRGRLGLRPRGGPPRRGHRRELRGHRIRHAERRLRRRGDDAGRNPRRGGGSRRRRPLFAADGQGGRQAADPFLRPRLWSASRSSRASTSSSCTWGRPSMRASRTRARSYSGARSTAFLPTASAAIRRSRRSSSPA